MNTNLPRIKELFSKLYSANIFSKKHPQEKEPEVWNSKILPLLDGYYDELETLGVDRTFSMGMFCFGIDYLTATKAIAEEKPVVDGLGALAEVIAPIRRQKVQQMKIGT